MELTKEQIDNLYKFTRQHYVEHYDVQTELVDHLANDIEEISKENPDFTFEKARDISFKKFGVFGFMDVVGEKQKQVTKKYRKILWKLFKEWFGLPKVMLTLLLTLLFYFLYQIPVYGKYVYYVFFILSFITIIIKSRLLIKQQKKKINETGKKWLLEDIIYTLASSNTLVLFSNIFNILNFGKLLNNQKWMLFLSFFSTLLLIIGYITLELIPKKSEELLSEHYPEYKLFRTKVV